MTNYLKLMKMVGSSKLSMRQIAEKTEMDIKTIYRILSNEDAMMGTSYRKLIRLVKVLDGEIEFWTSAEIDAMYQSGNEILRKNYWEERRLEEERMLREEEMKKGFGVSWSFDKEGNWCKNDKND
jgi:transcriptional regulator with XRE-family HTH domain